MMFPSLPFAAGAVRTTFEFGRIHANSDWILPVAVSVAVMIFVQYVYARDTEELGRRWAVALTALRLAVFLVLLVLYLQPQWRVEREVVRNSKVLMLVDTSSSMGVTDPDTSGTPGRASRDAQVADALGRSDFLRRLRTTHDVVVFRFDQLVKRLASLGKLAAGPADSAEPESAVRRTALSSSQAAADPAETIDWQSALAPSGTETRLGQALRELVQGERNNPLSGIVVFSDGGQNAGPTPEGSVELAKETRVPVFTVGLGSTQPPVNARVYKLEALPRAFPNDPYAVSGLIQAQGNELAGKSVTVDLLLRKSSPGAPSSEPGTGQVVGSQQVILGANGESVPVKFQITPTETGLHTICLRLHPPQGDINPADDFREADVEIVDRKDHILLVAGGPSREYRFLRTLLFRDKSVSLDVLLQSGQAGMSQEAAKILDHFPETREEMFDYDCVVALDPNWKALSAAQVDLLESWVGEQGGGLIVAAGPVYSGEAIGGWVQDPAMEKIRALYPVEFQRQVAVWETGAQASEQPWPIEFTREGMEADFLWLGDSETTNQQAWATFPGVYSFQPVRGVKPAAVTYARFGDPRSGRGGQQAVYMAGQFYGSGQAFFLGSGEMWRLRSVDENYFERFYTKLIRHVSQGRLLRQSSRGVLLVGQDRYTLGSTVELRARLTNAQLKPLDVPEVTLEATEPNGKVRPVALRPDPGRTGSYVGQLTVLQEGPYRLDLAVPESTERLSRRFQVALPDLERENPQQNDKLLMQIADGTGGQYFNGVDAALGMSVPQPLLDLLKDRTRVDVLTAAPDRLWEENWLVRLMAVLCGLLFIEWFVRRLLKLA